MIPEFLKTDNGWDDNDGHGSELEESHEAPAEEPAEEEEDLHQSMEEILRDTGFEKFQRRPRPAAAAAAAGISNGGTRGEDDVAQRKREFEESDEPGEHDSSDGKRVVGTVLLSSGSASFQ